MRRGEPLPDTAAIQHALDVLTRWEREDLRFADVVVFEDERGRTVDIVYGSESPLEACGLARRLLAARYDRPAG